MTKELRKSGVLSGSNLSKGNRLQDKFKARPPTLEECLEEARKVFNKEDIDHNG